MDDVVFVLGSEATRAAVDALTIRKKLNAEKLKVYVGEGHPHQAQEPKPRTG